MYAYEPFGSKKVTFVLLLDMEMELTLTDHDVPDGNPDSIKFIM